MNRFIVQLNDGGFMNIPADRMELKENFLFASRHGAYRHGGHQRGDLRAYVTVRERVSV